MIRTKILCVGDIHARDRAPRGAQEPYLEDLLDLLRQSIAVAVSRGADAIVWAGDVFHEKDPRRTSHATVQRMIEIVQSCPIPIFIVVGNHDISNDRLDSIDEKQPLGVLFKAGARRLNGWAEDFPLYGIEWQSDWHEEGTIQRVTAPVRLSKRTEEVLVVTHASLYPQGQEPPFDVLDIAEFADGLGNQGSLYYGHIHEDHGVFEVGGVTFANMGALSRGSRHEYNVQRDIKVALWENGKFEEITLDFKPATEVLLMEDHYDEKKSKVDLENFLASIGSRTLEISSIESVIEYIKSRTDVEPSIRNRAVEILEATPQ